VRRVLIAFATLAALFPRPAAADVITAHVWYEFRFGEPGSFAVPCGAGECVPSSAGNSQPAPGQPWTTTIATPASLIVTDAFLAGDRFEIFDRSTSLGFTSEPRRGPSCGDNPDNCVTDAAMSHGSFLLGRGSHDIAIRAALSPFGSGAGFFRLDSVAATPEPASILLIGVGAAYALRRRRSRTFDAG